MLWINLVLVTVLTGVVSSSLVCISSQTNQCRARMALTYQAGYEVCPLVIKYTDCLQSATIACGEESNQELKEGVELLTEMCQDGSELNRMLLRNKDCIFNSFSQALHCFDIMKEALVEVTRDTPTIEDLMRVACRYTNELQNCLVVRIGELCGQEAEEFARKGLEPDQKMRRRMCLDGGYPTGTGATGPAIGITLNILQFLFLIFISKMFF